MDVVTSRKTGVADVLVIRCYDGGVTPVGRGPVNESFGVAKLWSVDGGLEQPQHPDLSLSDKEPVRGVDKDSRLKAWAGIREPITVRLSLGTIKYDKLLRKTTTPRSMLVSAVPEERAGDATKESRPRTKNCQLEQLSSKDITGVIREQPQHPGLFLKLAVPEELVVCANKNTYFEAKAGTKGPRTAVLRESLSIRRNKYQEEGL